MKKQAILVNARFTLKWVFSSHQIELSLLPMKKGFYIIIMAAGMMYLLLNAGCATRKKSNCNCPGFGKEIHTAADLQKQS